jgi:hypothetical protein
MFKKRCSNCNKKVERSFDFCPYCSSPLRKKEDYGLLGKSDEDNFDKIMQNKAPNLNNLGGLFGGNFFNKALAGAFKMLENEIKQLDEQERRIEKAEKSNMPKVNTNFQLFINGKKVNLPQNMFPQLAIQSSNQSNNNREEKQKELPKPSEETINKSKKLPRKEAKSTLKRLKNSVIYELDTPGIDSINNVVVNKLEEAIEIKAFTEKAVFQKTLPIKLQLMKYSISPSEGKLILEFKA